MNFKDIMIAATLIFVSAVTSFGCSSTTPVPHDGLTIDLPQHSATVPAERLDQQWWEQRHAGVLDQVDDTDPDIVLIGDSITHGWDRQMDIWNAHFGDYDMVNMGFSGDRTQHVLWRFDHGEIDGISPEAAMIMIGTNNSNRADNTAQEIGDGIVAICATLRARLPETQLLLLAVFPRGETPSDQRVKNDTASAIAAQFAESDPMIHYLDISSAFLTDDGTLPVEVMPDLLHPNGRGYSIWAAAVEEKLNELLED